MSNIHSLPPEIVLLILRNCIRPINILYDTALPVMLVVCRSWRALAIQDPICWSRIHVELSRAQHLNPRVEFAAVTLRLYKWLSLVRDVPIDLSIWGEPGPQDRQPQTVALWQSLAVPDSNVRRFRSYWEAKSASILTPVSSFPIEALRSLTHLRLDCSPEFPGEVILPQLKVLSYQHLRKNNLLCPKLETFTISPTYFGPTRTHLNHVLETLQQYPTVSSLSVDLVNAKPANDVPVSYNPFRGIHTLTIGKVYDGDVGSILTHFPSTSTLIISDISNIELHHPSSGARIKELIILGHVSWRYPIDTAPRLWKSEVWDLLNSLHSLQCLRIGRKVLEYDPYCQFDWPHVRCQGEIQWSSLYLVLVFVRFLCSRTLVDEPWRLQCTQLAHIHLTSIHLGDYFLNYLMICLKDRYESPDKSVRRLLLTTKGCTLDTIGRIFAFPDVFGVSYSEFKAIVDNLRKSAVIRLLFGTDLHTNWPSLLVGEGLGAER
jgi:hypothetical protein